MSESLINIENPIFKQEIYGALIAQRKNCDQCIDVENPSSCESGKFDDNGHIGPWTDWQGNLEAEIMVVGQEWGGTDNYCRQRGRDSDSDPTNQNIVTLMNEIKIKLSSPSTLQGTNETGACFFTNGVLCLRKGAATNSSGKGNGISQKTFSTCLRTFLRAQIELIEPRFVLVLGKLPWNGLMEAYSMPTSATLKEALEGGSIRLNKKTTAFPLFHCGSKSNINRKLPIQILDWQKMKAVMDGCSA